MSKKVITGIHDEYVGLLNVVIQPNEKVAIRDFRNALKNHDSVIYANRADISLYKLGTVDTDTMEIIPEVRVLMVGDGEENV